MEPTQKTCFIIIGYGKKMDYATGREIDLDKTYEYIIKPVFEELGFLCFRASDIKHSGVIDIPMYENILKADFVLADLSTLNANVLYELGIRHAVRKNTTLIISEDQLKYPFDLSHIVIDKYEHLGKGIDYGEVGRFHALLKDKINSLLHDPKTDSPLYTLFPHLEIPKFTQAQIEEIKENIQEEGSLSDLMTKAEDAKNNRDYALAIEILEKAKSLNQENSLVTQRLALATYKSRSPTPIEALKKALTILNELNPESSTDLETLGLSGAIHKRLFEETGEIDHLSRAIRFYEKGLYIGMDYYNGINLAFLFNVLANKEGDRFLAFANFGNAIRIRKKVRELCENIIASKGWESREDKVWVYLTLAEILFSINDQEGERKQVEKAKTVADGTFALDSYYSQNAKLRELLTEFYKKYDL
jgi:tetratricopeptide (TPR) repeat protein